MGSNIINCLINGSKSLLANGLVVQLGVQRKRNPSAINSPSKKKGVIVSFPNWENI